MLYQKQYCNMQHHKEVIAMSMQETVDMFVDEILEEHLRRLQAESEECQDINRRLLKLSDKVQEHLNTLSDNQRKVLTDYSDTRNEQEGANYNYLYLAGLKDSIQILKFLEVL